MKREIIAIALLIFLLSGSLACTLWTKRLSGDVCGMLDRGILLSDAGAERPELLQLVSLARTRWEKGSPVAGICLSHTQIHGIDDAFREVLEAADTESYQVFALRCRALQRRLTSIAEMESISLRSVF